MLTEVGPSLGPLDHQPTVCHCWQPTRILPHLLHMPPDFFFQEIDYWVAAQSLLTEVGPSLDLFLIRQLSAMVCIQPKFFPTCYPCHLIFRLLGCSSQSVLTEVGPFTGSSRPPISLLRLPAPTGERGSCCPHQEGSTTLST